MRSVETGDWIEFGPLIIEVTSITETDVIGKIVDYENPTPKLKYGEPVVLSKFYLQED